MPEKKLIISDFPNNLNLVNSISWDKRLDKIQNICDLIEKKDLLLRKKFCKLIQESIILNFKNQSLLKNFLLDKKFSFLLTSNYLEKSIYKNKEIFNIIKLLALDLYIQENKIKYVYLNIENSKDVNSIKKLCLDKNIKIEIKYNLKFFFRKLFFFDIKLFFLLTPIRFVKFLFQRMFFRDLKSTINLNKKYDNIFFYYSSHTNIQLLSKKYFYSDFWGPLVKSQFVNQKKNLWINIYFPKQPESFNSLLKKHKNLNIYNNDFIFLEEEVDFKIIFLSYFYWLKNYLSYIQKKILLKIYLKKKKYLYLNYYLNYYFSTSFSDLDALTNNYYFFLLKKLNKKIKYKNNLFYLFENQGWEKSMLYNFRKFKKIYAVNHAAMRFWDMRLDYSNKDLSYINPDFYLVNGSDSQKKLVKFGFPRKRIKIVESLRYHNLGKKIKFKNNKMAKRKRHILIVSDVEKTSNYELFKLLCKLDDKIINNYHFILKEHPTFKFNHKINFNIKKTNQNFENLRKISDLAIVTNATSSILELMDLNFKIITPVGTSNLNLSPLKGNNTINFIKNYSEISNLITKLNKEKNCKYIKENDFFYFSKSLKKWKTIINGSSK